MKALPDHVRHHKSTSVFTEDTVPAGLLKKHRTPNGLWGLICVKNGELEYIIEEKETHILTPEQQGVIEPGILHHVRPLGKVSFYIRFYK